MKTILIVLTLITISPIYGADGIVNNNAIDFYKPEKQLEQATGDLIFWKERACLSSQNPVYAERVAAAYSRLFTLTGRIDYLKAAEAYLLKALDYDPIDRAATLRSLARNYISQHRFCEAQNVLIEALTHERDIRLTRLMMFDVYLELGEKELAEALLSRIYKVNDFNSLIRKAKLEDVYGNLSAAINLLEEAKTLAEHSMNRNQMAWIYSNLGDFYGHAGNLEASRVHFTKALTVNPADWYSMKGLAWMAWSGQGDSQLALELLDRISTVNQSPSIFILKADIIASMGNEKTAENELELITRVVESKAYGDMYNGFLVSQKLKKGEYIEALHLAQRELKMRPTPGSYSLLMEVYKKLGEVERARFIATEQILGNTYEPAILLKVLPLFEGEIKATLLDELVSCRYELGPIQYNVIEDFS